MFSQLGIRFLSVFLFAVVAFNVQATIKQNTVEGYLQQQKAEGKKPNHLINQSSPYLLQHAYNPVNWYPWGKQAFSLAKKEHKPIFLSIGYSTCHWCHVMEHESFENKKIAAYLNKHFISIKVDREERPDIDAVYMSATQLISGTGGWPMTVFVDNKLRPFHAATYYPPFSTGHNIGLMEVLKTINQLWRDDPQRIEKIASNVTASIEAMAKSPTDSDDVKVDSDIQQRAMKQISSQFDQALGGFSAAPKFPSFGIFALLSHQAKLNNKFSKNARHMMSVTLDAMGDGGIYDQLAGGFFRYSVDAQWQIPHFEKMLYIQALMSMAYLDFYTAEPKPRYKEIITEILHFAEREMESPQGGFYSALDADSERPDKPGEYAEGAYYLWSEAELRKSLTKAEFNFIRSYYSVEPEGNMYSDPRNEFGNTNILFIADQYRHETLTKKEKALLGSAKKKLNAIRLLRPRPHLDDKMITAWNSMMIDAYATAAKVFPSEKSAYIKKAIVTAKFVMQHLYNHKNGRLYRSYRAGKVHLDATLNDYAWTIKSFLALYDVSKNPTWLARAVALSQKQDAIFLDVKSGAYFDVSNADTNVLFRSKSIYDGALPASNAIVESNLKALSQRVSSQAERSRYRKKAERVVHAFAAVINDNPAATAMVLSQ